MTIKRFCDACGEIADKSWYFGVTECDENGDCADEQPLSQCFELCADCVAAIARRPLAGATDAAAASDLIEALDTFMRAFSTNERTEESERATITAFSDLVVARNGLGGTRGEKQEGSTK